LIGDRIPMGHIVIAPRGERTSVANATFGLTLSLARRVAVRERRDGYDHIEGRCKQGKLIGVTTDGRKLVVELQNYILDANIGR
jgi:hypothetical protein